MFNFGKAHPNEGADNVSTVSSLVSDGGAMFKGAGASGAGFIGDVATGINELAHGDIWAGLGDMGSGIMSGVGMLNPELAEEVPGLGVAAGTMQALGHGAEALNHTDDIDAGYQNNQFWSNTGDATLGAANALAAMDPTGVSELYVGGTTLALDGIGALSGWIGGEDYGFTAGSAIGGAEHLAFDTGQAMASGASDLWNWATN